MDTHATAETLEQAIGDRSAVVGVIGLGYVGLPLAQAFVGAGFRVLGFDVDPAKVDSLRTGKSYIRHIDSGWIARTVCDGSFEPTADMRRLAEADCLLICVPTPLSESRDPDLACIESTGRQLAAVLRAGQLIVLESTTYPGTTRAVLLPILAASDLQEGADFFLAYSPEREDPGNPQYSAATIPKVIGGVSDAAKRLACALYATAIKQLVPVSSVEVAEACKILENTYRAVNIALVNELKVLFERMGLNVWEVIEAAKTKPFGFQAFYPGPGLGGHCIPIDPFYLSWLARKHGLATRFIELAGEINTCMPHYVESRVVRALNANRQSLRGSRILILGIAYKPDVDDCRESPAFKIMELLVDGGAEITYHDPHIPALPRSRQHDLPGLSSQPLTDELLAKQDCVVIVTDHRGVDYDRVLAHARLIVDTRNALAKCQGSQAHVWAA